MVTYIDLDGDKNNQSKDLTKKLIEKETEKINKRQNIINSNMHSASEEILKAAQLEATMQDTRIKEIKEKILKDNQEEIYKFASTIKPIQFIPSKKSNKPPIINNINITHPPLVFPEQKKSWYKNLFWQLVAAAGSLLVAYLAYKFGW